MKNRSITEYKSDRRKVKVGTKFGGKREAEAKARKTKKNKQAHTD